ncbi:MAG: hypothetical protein H6R45_1257 [Proteobacteria bacterium]|nr:hypothetical protein [Pseudomonadota bacterium]
MVPLIEDDPAGRVRPPARSIDHHQRMIGDNQVSLPPRPLRSLDEALPIVGTAGINAFAPAIGERSGARTAKQARQPTRQVASDHVAILGIGRPAPYQLRKHCRPPGECALHRIFQIEQAQVILPPLADDDLPLSLLAIGE